MAFCIKCGTQLQDGANFCAKCGTPVQAAASNIGNNGTPVQAAASKISKEEADKKFNEAVGFYNDSYDLDRIEKSLPIFQTLAEQGHAGAQYYMGRLYHEDQGVDYDKEKSLYWYNKSAENGYAEAQDYIGTYLYYGEHMALAEEDEKGPDQNKGLEMLQKAAEQGHKGAKNELYKIKLSRQVKAPISCFEDAVAIIEASKDTFNEATEDEEAFDKNAFNKYDIEKYYKEANNKAFHAIEVFAEQGNVQSQLYLGDYYYKQTIINRSAEYLRKATDLYQKAAAQGNAEAQKKLDNIEKLKKAGAIP